MGDEWARLVGELKGLRKGRGILASPIEDRVGAALRELCAVSDEDGSALIRSKVGDTLRTLVHALPEDLSLSLQAAFALTAEARQPFYQDRVRWAAHRLARDERTVRRRIDEGIEQLAELAASSVHHIPHQRTTFPWHTEVLRVHLSLEQPTPESFEFRRIVADTDGLDFLDLALTLTEPTTNGHPTAVDGLDIHVFEGGNLVRKRMETSERYGFALELPRTLRRGEKHNIALRFRVTPGRTMQPHYVCLPKNPCDVMDLHVRFDPARRPGTVWRLSDVFQRDVSDPVPSGEALAPDRTGELHVRFTSLRPNLAYGVRWD